MYKIMYYTYTHTKAAIPAFYSNHSESTIFMNLKLNTLIHLDMHLSSTYVHICILGWG